MRKRKLVLADTIVALLFEARAAIAGAHLSDARRISMLSGAPVDLAKIIVAAARQHSVDARLLAAVALRESNFRVRAVSPVGALGVMQLMPRTAREIAPAAGIASSDARALTTVPTNVRLGTTLLRRLIDRYDGSQAKALAAYNAGEDAVAKWERRYGVRPDDEFTEVTDVELPGQAEAPEQSDDPEQPAAE